MSKRNKSLRIKVGNREIKEVDNFKYLESGLTKYGFCIREIKMRIFMAKEALNRCIVLPRDLDI